MVQMDDENLVKCDKCGELFSEDEICKEHSFLMHNYCIYCCEECQKELRDSDYINGLIDSMRDEQLFEVQE